VTGLVLCIDPGPEQSGYVLVQDGKVIEGGHICNEEVLDLSTWAGEPRFQAPTTVIIEWLSCYGSMIGQTVLRTAEMCGRVRERLRLFYEPVKYIELTRPEVCRRLTGKTRSITKAVIRRAVIDIMGEVGTKPKPGPLYIMRKAGPHAWDALALFAAYCHGAEHEKGTEAGE